MGVLGNLFSRPKPAQSSRLIPLGKDKNDEDVTWNLDTEHHAVFVGSPKECVQARSRIQDYVMHNPLSCEYVELFAPEHRVLQRGGPAAVNAIKDFKAFLDPVEKDIYERISGQSATPRKSLVLCIQNAAFFSIREKDWAREYPAIPYKAARYFTSKLQAMMSNTQEENVYIILMDDHFSDYGYLAEAYRASFGVETDEHGAFYKVPF